MRIAIATDAWKPQINGVVTTTQQLIHELRRMRHYVELIEPNMFTTVPCPTYPEIRLAIYPNRRMNRLLTAFKPEAIHMMTEGPIGLAARRFCVKRGMPFTTSLHTRFPEYVNERTGIPLSIGYTVMRWLHAKSVCTMVSTPKLKEELEGRGLKNLALWSRGVDTNVFRIRPKDFLAGVRPIYLYVGRVSVEKNLQAFLDLPLEGTKYVVGDGPALPALKKKYPDAIFVGAKTGGALARCYAAADVFVFPSKTDTFGLVILEANASGVPVAAYSVQGPKEIIKNGVNGWVNDDLKEAVDQALKIDPLSCRTHAEQYSWRKSAEQFLKNLAPIKAR